MVINKDSRSSASSRANGSVGPIFLSTALHCTWTVSPTKLYSAALLRCGAMHDVEDYIKFEGIVEA